MQPCSGEGEKPEGPTTTFSGIININGITKVKIIDFNSLQSAFNIHFQETGLPHGDRWSVTINNISQLQMIY